MFPDSAYLDIWSKFTIRQMYFTSVVLLNSPYFYKKNHITCLIFSPFDVKGFSVMCSEKVWKIIVLITLKCTISHFSAHLTFPYFFSGGPCKHQMLKAKLCLLILSEMTKKSCLNCKTAISLFGSLEKNPTRLVYCCIFSRTLCFQIILDF